MNLIKFDSKYRKDWDNGNISQESITDLIVILQHLDMDLSISRNIDYHISDIIRLLIRYRFDKGCQSINWIEPIRLDNWALHSWINIDPEILDSCYDIDSINIDIDFGFYYIYSHDNYIERISDSLRKELLEEFTIENLASIDYIENYLKKYAKNSKVKRYLQIL